MFENFKGILSVVQDGLQSGTNLRHTLSEVQKVKFTFNKKLDETKQKCPVPLDAGAEILSHHQRQWEEIHAGAELVSETAVNVDKLITHIHSQAAHRMTAASDLYQSLQTLPKLTSSVEECIEKLSSIEELVCRVEEELQQFEDLVDRQKMHENKMEEHRRIARYKHTKLESLERQRASLACESRARQTERERQQMSLLQSRAEMSARLLSRDLQLYRDQGILPATNPREGANSGGLSLEQVELESDRGDLEAFLES